MTITRTRTSSSPSSSSLLDTNGLVVEGRSVQCGHGSVGIVVEVKVDKAEASALPGVWVLHDLRFEDLCLMRNASESALKPASAEQGESMPVLRSAKSATSLRQPTLPNLPKISSRSWSVVRMARPETWRLLPGLASASLPPPFLGCSGAAPLSPDCLGDRQIVRQSVPQKAPKEVDCGHVAGGRLTRSRRGRGQSPPGEAKGFVLPIRCCSLGRVGIEWVVARRPLGVSGEAGRRGRLGS